MKTKNVILGILAIVFSVGGALTSYSMDDSLVTYYVRAQQIPGGSITCEPTNASGTECTGGSTTCGITINLVSGTNNVSVKTDTGCANTLLSSPANIGTFNVTTFTPVQVYN